MDADIEVVASGPGLLESMRWAHGSVWISAWTAGRIHRLHHPASKHLETVAEVDLDRGAFSCAWADELATLFVATAHWPDPQGLTDPTHVWDGTLLAITPA